MKQWISAEKIPVLIFMGDRLQMPGMGHLRPWHSKGWVKECKHVKLTTVWRCKDKVFAKLLDKMRAKASKPENGLCNDVCRRHKAWNTAEPTPYDIKKLYEKHPNTKLLACTREGERILNDLALSAHFPDREPICTIDGDVKQNVANYNKNGLRKDRHPRPSRVPIHIGMQLVLTQNRDKDNDF
eukprot:2516761-Karenia_brevis.AAC.1